MDGLAAVVLVTVAAVGLLVLVAAAAEVTEGRTRCFGLMLLFLAAVLLTVTASTLPGLLLAWEIMGATSWALIGHQRDQGRRVASGTTAFLVTRAGDLGAHRAARTGRHRPGRGGAGPAARPDVGAQLVTLLGG